MAFESASNGYVKLDVSDGVAEIRLDHPEKLNCFSYESMADFEEVILTVKSRDDVAAIVLTGEGKAFSSGADTSRLEGDDEPDDSNDVGTYTAFEWLLNVPIPVIVGARGYAVGAGASLLTYVADIAYVGSDIQIWWPDIDYGVLVHRAPVLLYPQLGYKKTIEMLLLGGEERMDAEEAYNFGLVNGIVEPHEVDDRARTVAHILAEHETDHGLVTELMELMHRVRRDDTGSGRDYAAWRRTEENFGD